MRASPASIAASVGAASTSVWFLDGWISLLVLMEPFCGLSKALDFENFLRGGGEMLLANVVALAMFDLAVIYYDITSSRI